MSRHLLPMPFRLAHLLMLQGLMAITASAADVPEKYRDVITRFESAIRFEMEAKKLPALSFAVVDGKEVIWAEGFGFADGAGKVPATAATVYRVGSVSKLFTDIAVMQMVEAGKIHLDQPVTDYLPDFKPRNDTGVPVTLRQLMSHRSGLVRESPVGNYFDSEEPTLAATVESLNATSLVYPPDTKTKYSNAGIAVVGAVVERMAGKDFAEHIQTSILEPLGMESSSFILSDEIRAQLAAAWMWTYDGRRFEAPTFALGTAPAGNLYANVLDLGKFMVCLFKDGSHENGELLRPETLATMMTPGKDREGKPQGFGIGFHVQDLDGHRKIGHGGAVYGFSTQLEALPDRKLGVAAVSSLDGSNGVVGRLADYALRLLIAAQDQTPIPTYRTTGPLPPERARSLVGEYQSGENTLRVEELGGRVYLRSGVFRQELRAANDDGEIIVDDPLDFGTKVQLRPEGELQVGDRTYRRCAAEPPQGCPERFRGLIGEYGWDHNTLYILEDHGQLFALIEWFYYYPLQELSDNEFAFPGYGLYHGEKLKFVRDAAGNGTSVVAAEVTFARRAVGTREGETFKIKPLKPIDELRASALEAQPPEEEGNFLETDLVELTALDPTLKLDIRYATTNNFTGSVFYKQPRAFMQRSAAEAVVRVHRALKERGLGLLIHDAYRPWHVTKMFWDATPNEMKDFVANPASGSRHNRGCAVDLTLFDLATGQPVPMVAGYDEFSPRSFPMYPGGTSRQRWFRELLRRAMEGEGFTVYEYEWWHFDYKDWKKYRIGNVSFEALAVPGASAAAREEPSIERTVAQRGYDGKMCWVHARAGAIPRPKEKPLVVMTTQRLLLTGSDVFYPLHDLKTSDLGESWSPPRLLPTFERRQIDPQTEMTVCDFTPKWHAKSGKLLGIGQTVWYRDNRVMEVRPRASAYATYDEATGAWSAWNELELPDEPFFKNCGAGSVQRYDLPDGDILLPVYFKVPDRKQYSVTVLRCRFDGRDLRYVEHGDVLTVPVQRGFVEPSLAKYGKEFFLTLRNDVEGYVAKGSDGLHYQKPIAWKFDDGSELGNYNTQQHWIANEHGLFLVYTRKGAANDHVFRHRAPLFFAEVDPQTLTVRRATERVLVPQRGARLGNFGITEISPNETWVTVTEWMQTWGPNIVIPVDNAYGADNSIYVVKLKWSPNQ